MTDTYRRFTTAELRAMPETAQMMDRQGRIWERGLVEYADESHWGYESPCGRWTAHCCNSELAKLLLRRIK